MSLLITRKNQAGVQQALRDVPLFRGLDAQVLAHFAEHAQQSAVKKGEVLFSPDSPNDRFFIVTGGWIKLFRETLSGDEAVIDIMTAPQSFGEIGMSGGENMPYGAQAIEDATLIALPRFLLAEEVRRNGVFGLSVLQSLTRQKISRDMEIEHRTVQTAPQRIGCFLLKLCGEKTDGAVTLHLPYDKTVIASRLGMQPETFSRALKRLRDETGLRIKGAAVEIDDIRTLIGYTCSACSSTFPCKEQ